VSTVDLALLLEAASPGGASCITSVTELEPAAGSHGSVAPAKFAGRDSKGTYAYERRYLDGTIQHAVLIDSKQSQLNRCEQALQLAITDGHPVLGRMPRIVVTYLRDSEQVEYSDLTLPHRAFDGHIRAGAVDGQPVTKVDAYRALRNATPANARALLDASPVSLIFGSWDSSRASRQGRWRSALVGEIIGFCADADISLRGGARTDPVGMKIELGEAALKELAKNQRAELSRGTYDKVNSEAKKATGEKRVSASMLGLGGIPPTLDALAGVACHRIVRSHVLSFATLRQIRFGAGADGDAACRALLAALALNALARSDAELCLRANCDLVQKQGTARRVEIDRGADRVELESLSVAAADALLAEALATAERSAGVQWNGVVMWVTGNPEIVAGSVDEERDA
jgi:CRISPR-associated protein Csb1